MMSIAFNNTGCGGCAIPNLTGCWIDCQSKQRTHVSRYRIRRFKDGILYHVRISKWESAFESFYGMHLSTCFALHCIPVLTLYAFIGITHLNDSLWLMQCSQSQPSIIGIVLVAWLPPLPRKWVAEEVVPMFLAGLLDPSWSTETEER